MGPQEISSNINKYQQKGDHHSSYFPGATANMGGMGCCTEVEVVYDDGSDWLLGHLPCLPEMVGYFPKDYVVSVEEYEESNECKQCGA